MKNLSFKAKILLLVLIPLVLVSTALTALAIFQAKELGDNNLKTFAEKIYDLRRNELKNYTEMALTSVKHIYNNETEKRSPEAQESAKTILRNLAYGSDGYIFVYDYDGTNVVLPTKPEIEGKNLWNIQDKNGVRLIQELVNDAQRGGGYTDYVWDKPSKGEDVDKISYSLGLNDWRWMVGTGLYVDDLDDAIAGVQSEVDSNISKTWKLVASLALACTIIVGFIGARLTISEGKLADEQLQLLSHKAVEGQEEERMRVARDLQKGINQSLYASRLKLKEMAKITPIENDEARRNFVGAINILDKTIKEVNRISGELRPEMLDSMGLYSAVEALATQISQESNIAVTFKKSNTGSKLPNEFETAVYRIIQEALKNIVNHSHASTANIRIRQTDTHLNVTIQDNGSGFNTKKILDSTGKAGVGFVDIRVRAESLGGHFSIFSSEEIGTVLKVDIPL